MKNRFYWIVFLILLGGSAIAQKKQLTLEDAIINRYGKLGADRLEQLQWLPNKHICSYVENDELIKAYMYGKRTPLFTLKKLNRLLGDSLKRMPRFAWVDNDALAFYYKGDRVVIKENAGRILSRIALPKGARNLKYCDENETYAFTRENNLFVTKGGIERIVTQDADKNHVYGQTVSRNEFGISGGIFWSPKGKYLAFYKKDESKVSDYPLVNYMGRVGELKSIKYPMVFMTWRLNEQFTWISRERLRII